MNKCVLRNEKGVMVKTIDTANTKLELTTDPKEALNYSQGDWFARSELEFLQFHYKDEYPDVMTMTAQWINDDPNEKQSAAAWGPLDEEAVPNEPIHGEDLVGYNAIDAQVVNQLVGGDEMFNPVAIGGVMDVDEAAPEWVEMDAPADEAGPW